MRCDLDAAESATRDRAMAVARDLVAPAAPAVDATATVPVALRDALKAAIGGRPGASAYAAWAITIEQFAIASPTLALMSAADALGGTANAPAQWAGLRGLDVDQLAESLADDAAWQLAVTATLVGAAGAAVQAALDAMRSAKAAGRPNDGAPLVADAATAVSASRLLLWDATGEGGDTAPARALARLHVLDTAALAWTAAERACGPHAFRPGSVLERLRRDTVTVAHVLGAPGESAAAVAKATLPA